MAWGLLLAVLAAIFTAVATVLQAIGARHARRFQNVDPRLLLSVLRSRPYVIGLVLLTMSFVVTVLALYSTPLFVVQAIAGASLAFIAAISWVFFQAKLTRPEWIAIGSVFAGVVLLVVAQQPSTSASFPLVGQWALLGAAGALAVVAFTASRLLSGAAVPGLFAGLAFGDAAVGSRVIADQALPVLLASPTIYAVGLSGLLGVLLYATALQRGSVTAVFAASTVGQTLGPAATGWLLLGDSVHAGLLPVAAVGFGLTVAGAIFLARHSHPDHIHASFIASRVTTVPHVPVPHVPHVPVPQVPMPYVSAPRLSVPHVAVAHVHVPQLAVHVTDMIIDERTSPIDKAALTTAGRLRSLRSRRLAWPPWRAARKRAAARATTS